MNRGCAGMAGIWAFGLLLMAAGCGPKQRAAEGLLDLPVTHYNQGMRNLDDGDLDAAQAQFEDALLLDAKYAPGHAGLCLVNASRGAQIANAQSKERKGYFEQAGKALEKAKSLDSKDISVWIAHIRFCAARQKGDDWISDSEKGFKKALKLDPHSDPAYYFMGMAYLQAYEFNKAEEMLSSAINIDGAYAEMAGQALRNVHKIVEAQPGTKYGKMIALAPRITRADLAVLFIEELNVISRIQFELQQKPMVLAWPQAVEALGSSSPTSRGEPENPTDISGHWAESFIRDYVKVGLGEVLADHKFYPDQPVMRIEFAGAVQKLMYLVTRDESIFAKYVGEQASHIHDLRTDHPYYGAAMLCVERGVMELDKASGDFDPQGHINGADAVLFIRDVKNAMKW